jgi:hypothetical protein
MSERERRLDVEIPGWEGSIGPGPGQYGRLHVYARDTGSGVGNCRCGHELGHWLHVQAAPGVPVPDSLRRAGWQDRQEQARRRSAGTSSG